MGDLKEDMIDMELRMLDRFESHLSLMNKQHMLISWLSVFCGFLLVGVIVLFIVVSDLHDRIPNEPNSIQLKD